MFQNQEVAKSTDALSAQNKENQPREAHCPLLTQPRKFPPGPSSQGLTQPEEGASRSPIYKGQSHKGAEVMADKSWSNGAGNQSRERLVRPGTPYTEIDESKVGLNKKVNVKTCNSNCFICQLLYVAGLDYQSMLLCDLHDLKPCTCSCYLLRPRFLCFLVCASEVPISSYSRNNRSQQ